MNQGTKVKVHYTGTLNDGTVFDSSEGKEPLEFTIGESQVIKGFEDGIKEMKLNEERTINIKPEDAYGESQEQLVMSIPREKFPENVEVNGKLVIKSPDGQSIPAFVKEVNKDSVVIDLNHPLAGKELTFKVKIVEVN